MKRNLLLGTLLLVGIVSAIVIFGPFPMRGSYPVLHAPQVGFEATIDNQTESVRVVHEGDDPLSSNYTSRVVVQIIPAGGEKRVNATLVHDGTRVQNGVWAARTPPAATAFPLKEGSSVQVVSDGVDRDGDGTAGIEPGDEIVVTAFFHSEYDEQAVYLRWCPPDGSCPSSQ